MRVIFFILLVTKNFDHDSDIKNYYFMILSRSLLILPRIVIFPNTVPTQSTTRSKISAHVVRDIIVKAIKLRTFLDTYVIILHAYFITVTIVYSNFFFLFNTFFLHNAHESISNTRDCLFSSHVQIKYEDTQFFLITMNFNCDLIQLICMQILNKLF